MTGPAAMLRARLARPEILVVPGGGSPLELKLIERAGFEAAYVSGYAAAASRYGVPDIGLVAYGESSELVRAARQVTDIPLIVDCDTGYGDVANVVRTVRGLEALGVAAVQIEDQAWPKRCGHMDDKIVEPEDVALRKIDAAVSARRSDTVVIARTDARGPYGIEVALERCRKFRDVGADVLFVDGPQSNEELALITRELDGPLMVNMSESGKTPISSAAELEAMGFSLVIFPSSTVRITVRQVADFLADLRTSGDSRAWINRMASLEETNAALGLPEVRAFEADILKRAAR
ncbi:isocitrate lyase/PEP mutase family protein [Xanthobacter tagetidis]|nr:isocitrate lyase/PEP mutase family protein [Xanthobacter tagetidis]MBB6306075.1 2-methylisocitrate lyase-like PEP mutase family enzyme [Xanthobacter tagetidis]